MSSKLSPCKYMDYGVETIKRQTGAACGCLVAGKNPWMRAQIAACRLYIRTVCDTKAPLQMQLRLAALYKCCKPLLSAQA